MRGGPSSTAIATAIARGRHRLYDPAPWVLDDPFALLLVGPTWHLVEERTAALYPDDVARAYVGGIVGRSRYAEDRLVEGGHRQYVNVGAGLDSFAWRRPDVTRALAVFEVDHPATLDWKRERAAALGLPEMATVTHVPVDLEQTTLRQGLDAAGLDWSVPTFFSWLGVTMYLTPAAVEATLRTVAGCAPGTEIVLSYAPTDDELDDLARRFGEIAAVVVAAVGEPFTTRLSRADAEALVRRCGLQVADHPRHDDLVARYFASRTDGLRPYRAEGLLAARTPA